VCECVPVSKGFSRHLSAIFYIFLLLHTTISPPFAAVAGMNARIKHRIFSFLNVKNVFFVKKIKPLLK
jgi:hypothetical protein